MICLFSVSSIRNNRVVNSRTGQKEVLLYLFTVFYYLFSLCCKGRLIYIAPRSVPRSMLGAWQVYFREEGSAWPEGEGRLYIGNVRNWYFSDNLSSDTILETHFLGFKILIVKTINLV